jgi:RNA polymerase sigma-70 factor, ECF subfamily
MDLRYSAVDTDNARLLLVDIGASDGTWPLDWPTQPSPAFNHVELPGAQAVGGSGKPEGKHSHSAIEAPEGEKSNVAAETSPHVPITDYRLAPDTQLLAAARSADGLAFGELSRRNAQLVQRTAFRILRNREDAEDVVQEAYFKAYTHLGEFRASCTFSTWLTTIVINCARMVLRKRKSHCAVSLDQSGDGSQTWGVWEFADPRPNAEEVYARRQTMDMLSVAAERLPSCYRSVVEKYHAKGQSLLEAADTLGISASAAKSRLLRARRAMRTTLQRKRISWADARS